MQKRYVDTTPRRKRRTRRIIIAYILLPAALAFLMGFLIGRMVPVGAVHAQKLAHALLSEPESTMQEVEEPLALASDKLEENPPRYALTESERTLVGQVVAAEAIGEPHDGQMAVAECILNACEKDGIRPPEAIGKYKYAKSRKEPTESIKQAVRAVFDVGEAITDEPIIYFYAPDRTMSTWHESQEFVLEIGGHRFFK